jgi:hypothetical protein
MWMYAGISCRCSRTSTALPVCQAVYSIAPRRSCSGWRCRSHLRCARLALQITSGTWHLAHSVACYQCTVAGAAWPGHTAMIVPDNQELGCRRWLVHTHRHLIPHSHTFHPEPAPPHHCTTA